MLLAAKWLEVTINQHFYHLPSGVFDEFASTRGTATTAAGRSCHHLWWHERHHFWCPSQPPVNPNATTPGVHFFRISKGDGWNTIHRHCVSQFYNRYCSRFIHVLPVLTLYGLL
jgi:hypothetical protein